MKMMTTAILLSLVAVSCSSPSNKEGYASPYVARNERPQTLETVGQYRLNNETAQWSKLNKAVLAQLVYKYGEPHEATPNTVTWYKKGQWEKIVLTNEPNNNLHQTAHLEVPPERMADIAMFNENISIDPANEQVTAISNREELNVLALNYARDILDSSIGPTQAKVEYKRFARKLGRTRNLEDPSLLRQGQEEEY